jgi:hypothetical protein
MNKKVSLIYWIVLIGFIQTLFNCQTPVEEKGEYIPGGRNIEAFKYVHSEGFPAFPDKAHFIGVLSGDWYQMGKQFGLGAAESTRYVSDIWWKEECGLWGKAETLKAFELYQAQIAAYDPNLVEFMKGLCEGASLWLDQSPYADTAHELYATNYQRVLAANLWDAWTMMHPRTFPDGSSTHGGKRKPPPPERRGIAGCSAFAAWGNATMGGIVISAQNRHSPFDPRCYQQVYIIEPEEGQSCWILTNSPQVAANQVVNDKGVSISLLAGGATNPRSLNHEGKAYWAEGFGVPWFHLFLYIGTHAESAEEAIALLTLGTQEYRQHTGRETLLRCGGWNFLVADRKTLAVVEATADRYAVRYAGDALSFSGPEWNDTDYIVATNHFICDHSYDKDNTKTDVPMTLFMDGYSRDRETGTITGLSGSGERFWTLMWDIKHNYGRIDRFRAQQIMSGAYAYDKDTGEKIEVAQDRDGQWQIYGATKPCTMGFISQWGGTCDSKVAVLSGINPTVYWTLGNPRDWQGAWDAYRFSGNSGKQR